jgi:hypothetical protein
VRHLEIGAPAQTIDSLDDTAAVLTVSGGSGNALEVLSATSTACTVLGYTSTSQLVGLHCTQIIPEPLRQVWQARFEGIVQRGFGPYLGFAEVALVQSTNGSVTPCVISLQEATPDEDSSRPRLQLAFDLLASRDNILVFAGSGQQYRVLCASQRTLSLLGSDAQTLEKEPAPATRWLPSLAIRHQSSRTRRRFVQGLELHAARAALGLDANGGGGGGGGESSHDSEGHYKVSGMVDHFSHGSAPGGSSALAPQKEALRAVLDALVPIPKDGPGDRAVRSASSRRKGLPTLEPALAREVRRLLLIVLAEGASIQL